MDWLSLLGGAALGAGGLYMVGTIYHRLRAPRDPRAIAAALTPDPEIVSVVVSARRDGFRTTAVTSVTVDGVLQPDRVEFRDGAGWRRLDNGMELDPLDPLWDKLCRAEWLAHQNGGTWVNPHHGGAS